MHLFKHFFKLMSRNRTGLIIYGIITIIMVVMLVFTAEQSQMHINGLEANSKNYNISYVDKDGSAVSQGLIKYLSQNNNVSDFGDKDETEISNIVFFWITDYHFTIPEGFADSVNNGDTDNNITFSTASGSVSYTSYEIDSMINNYLNTYRNYRSLGYSEEESIDMTLDLLSNKTVLTIVAKDNAASSKDSREIVLNNLNQYYPYIIIGILCLGVGHTILITNKKELRERNRVSPVPGHITGFINTLGLVISGIVIWACFMAFNFIYGAGSEIIKNFGWVIAINSLLCTLTCCAIAALLTSLIKTSNTLSMVTNIIGLSMSFFCGVFVPLRFIGDKVLIFSKFLPFYWTVYANAMTSSWQTSFEYDLYQVLICFGVEFLFAVAISAIAIMCNSKSIIKE